MNNNSILNAISIGIAVTGAFFNSIFGGWDIGLKTLLLFMLFDFITGLLCAAKVGNISSSIGFEGLKKKVHILIIIAVAVGVDNVTGTGGAIRSLVIFFYASNEGISILENAAKSGVPVPEKLKGVLLQMNDKENDEEVK